MQKAEPQSFPPWKVTHLGAEGATVEPTEPGGVPFGQCDAVAKPRALGLTSGLFPILPLRPCARAWPSFSLPVKAEEGTA